MDFLSAFQWSVPLTVLALIHFFRRRPDSVWLWVIIFFHGVGALVYIVMEVVPDLGLLRQTVDSFGRRKRVAQLQALVVQNPSIGNYEELADLYLEDGKYARARECYDKAISPRTELPDPFYRRGITEIHLGDFPAAVRDLEWIAARDPRYDSHRAMALLAHAYANTAQPEKADALFRQVTELSTLSETLLNYALFLESQRRPAEAREWVERVLASKATMPRYLQRRERPLFRQAAALLKRLPKA